jgi:protein TonB
MTNKEILQADLLDIIFENRNKAYGAYALRKTYHYRLQWALGISLSLIFLLLMIRFGKENPGGEDDRKKSEIILSTIEIPKPKTETPQFRKPPEGAQIRNTRIEIVTDDRVKKPEVPTPNELQSALTSTVNRTGIPPDSLKGLSATTNNNEGSSKQSSPQTEIRSTSSEAQFPGGKEAFAKFLTKYLITPDDLEAGEKKIVLVRFMVDIDGTISKIEITQSDADEYGKEVVRVLNKMPKWIPAMQNGIRTATWFTQPVTFIGVE